MAKFSMPGLLKEARRRRVFRVFAIYIVSAWVLLQVADNAFPAFNIPESAIRYVYLGIILAIPVVVVIGWRYDLDNGRIVRTSNVDEDIPLSLQRSDYVLLLFLSAVVVAIVVALGSEISVTQSTSDETDWTENVYSESIAVLPFVNRSSNSNYQYLADGISEELINALAKTPALRVTSRTSSFSFRNKDLSTQGIAKRLDVAYILEGSVRRTNNTIRITAQLIDARVDSYLWADAFDLTIDDVFAVQDEIALAIAENLKVNLIGGSTDFGTMNSDAYILYLQANHIERQQTEQSILKAEQLLKQSLAIDPSFSRGWLALCRLYSNSVFTSVYSRDDGYANAKDSCGRALAHDQESGAVHAELGWLASYVDNDLTSAARYIQRAWELDPSNEIVMSSVASFLQELGRLSESINLRSRLVSLDPVNPIRYYNLGTAHLYNKDYEKAALNYQKVIDLSPDFLGGRYALGLVDLMMGRYELALQQFELEGDEFFRVMGRALAHYALGDANLAGDAMDDFISLFGEEWPDEIAKVYSFWNDSDNAFIWLSRGEEDPGGWGEARLNPLFDNIVDDPRWRDHLVKLGLSDGHLSQIQFDVDTTADRNDVRDPEERW